jgi:hypothetical protein
MNANTQTVSIRTTPDKLLKFIANPANLPRWAVGFAKSIRSENGRWLVMTGSGEVGVRVEADERSGVVDFVILPAPGVEARAASRVVPRGEECEYVFTQLQAPGMPDEVFAKNVQAVAHELAVLKALLEVECPL